MSNQGNARYTFMENNAKYKRSKYDFTHKELQEAIHAINTDPERMVYIKAEQRQEKPSIYWNKELRATVYSQQSDKLGYIAQLEGIDRAWIILPITREVITRYEEMLRTKSIVKVEKELFKWLVNENYKFNVQRNSTEGANRRKKGIPHIMLRSTEGNPT